MKKYRKIFEQHFGKIPKGIDIHHLDINRENNDLDNLSMFTRSEHATVHFLIKLLKENFGKITSPNIKDCFDACKKIQYHSEKIADIYFEARVRKLDIFRKLQKHVKK
jgi:hypothetical protein